MFVGVVTDRSFHEAIALVDLSLQEKVTYLRHDHKKYHILDYVDTGCLRYQNRCRIYLDEYKS